MILNNYETIEENFTPVNYEEVKDYDRFHHSRKGCKCEIVVEKVKNVKNVSDSFKNWAYTKYCHTHKVLCSKTGWELGWYMDEKAKKFSEGDKNWDDCACGNRFVNSYDEQLGMCHKCFKKNTTTDQKIELMEAKRVKRSIQMKEWRNKKLNKNLNVVVDN